MLDEGHNRVLVEERGVDVGLGSLYLIWQGAGSHLEFLSKEVYNQGCTQDDQTVSFGGEEDGPREPYQESVT